MRLRHLGYACLNKTLGTKSRTLRLANLRTEAIIAPIVQNLDDVVAMLHWNLEHDIRFLRVSSDLIPFASHAEFPFDWQEAFRWKFDEIRRLAKAEKLRISIHPGQYTVLNSPREKVVEAAIAELEYHAALISLLDPKQGTMTLHVGGAYGDKPAALDRFVKNLDRLSDDARARLAIENDDKTFTLAEVVGLGERAGLPVIVDLFHHQCNPSGATWGEGLLPLLERAMGTWGRRIPKMHLSSQKPGTKTSHADFLLMEDVQVLVDAMEQVGGDEPYDLMLEAKMKECALLEVQRYLTTGEAPDRPTAMLTDAI